MRSARVSRRVLSVAGLTAIGLTTALALGPLAEAAPAPGTQQAALAAASVTRSRPVVFRTVRTKVKGAKATTVLATYRGTNPYVKRSVETAVAALSASRLAAFNDAYFGPGMGGHVGEYQLTGTLVANASPVLAMRFDEYMDAAGAHPTNGYHAIVVNSRTGRVWSQRDIVDALTFTVPEGTSLLAEVRKVVAQQLTGTDVSDLALQDVTLVPTSSGLKVLVDRCVLTCAAGSVEATIPWKRILAPKETVEFVPAVWRR